MSNKNNLNKSVMDVFGAGKEKTEEKPAAAANSTAAPKAKEPATFIAPTMQIEGNIKAKGDVEIAGELKGDVVSEGLVTVRSSIDGNITAVTVNLSDCVINGDIIASGDVIVTEKTVVNGNIKAKSLGCSGKVNGDVVVEENLSLDSSACIVGKITTGTMIVARGAIIKGNIEMRS